MNSHVRAVLGEIDRSEQTAVDLTRMSKWVQVSPATLAKQIRRGEIKASRDGRRYLIGKSEAKRIVVGNRSMLMGWKRLVDVTSELGFHRNIGESVCRKLGLEKELDMNGHCRISPDAEARLRAWHGDKQKHAGWKRKTDCARELELDPRVVDNLCRKLKLEIDHDIHGYVVLSEGACSAVEEWKMRRDRRRMKVRSVKGQEWYSLRKTAEDSASDLMHPSSPEYDHLVETYYRRFLLWMRNGLPYEVFDGVRYFSKDVHDRLVDDLCVMEAARLGGVGVSTVKGWLSKGLVSSSDYFKCRRSISRRDYTQFLRKQYAESPRLKKKQKVPVRIIEDLDVVMERTNLAGIDMLIAAIERETGIPERELEPLRYRNGFVHRAVKNTLDKWVLLAEQGERVKVGFSEKSNEPVGGNGDNAQRKLLLRLVSTFLQKEADEVYDLIYEKFEQMPMALKALVDLIKEHSDARVYNPERGYEVGNLLVHPSGGDYGFVTNIEGPRTIQVAWELEFGSITMAQNAESDYGAHDVPVLALH